MRVLWLSRHPLSAEQLADLTHRLGGVTLDVIQQNMTFSSDELEAMWQIAAATDAVDASVIAGVFPAHVAMQLALHQQQAEFMAPNLSHKTVAVPVSKPVFALDGEQRGFAHARWVIYGD
jgi:hypothetical protein